MARPPPSTLSRKDIISLISKFYAFLTSHPFLPASAIKTPPSEGWPPEHRSIFLKLGKSEEVVDLLLNLPYIDDNNWEWFHDTKPINFTSPLNLRRINGDYENKRYLFEPEGQNLTENVVSLTNGRVYGVWLLLDVLAGTITEYSVLNGPTPEISENRDVSGSGWRLYPTKPIGEFFTKCQEKMQRGNSSAA